MSGCLPHHEPRVVYKFARVRGLGFPIHRKCKTRGPPPKKKPKKRGRNGDRGVYHNVIMWHLSPHSMEWAQEREKRKEKQKKKENIYCSEKEGLVQSRG